jgi:hypothetical protein
MRGRRTVLIGITFAAGCTDVLSPAEYIGEYALTRVAGNALPAFVFDNGSVSAVVVADTIRVRSDGTGSRTSVRVYTNVNRHVAITAPTRVEGTTEFVYRVVQNRLEITTVCAANANCAPPPHVVAIRTSGGLRVTFEGIARVPQEYSVIGAR